MNPVFERINYLKEIGNSILKQAMGVANTATPAPLDRIRQDITNRFNEFSKTVLPITTQLKQFQAIQNLKPQSFQRPQAPNFPAIQQRFVQATTNRLDELKPRFQEFQNDFQQRVQRVDQQFIQPVQKEVGSFVNFVQGKDEVRNKRLAELYPQPSTQEGRDQQMMDMAINFSPMGVTSVAGKVGKPILKGLAEEGKAILSKLPKEARLQHIVGYANELLRAGFSKPQIDKIGAQEAAAILKKNITPSERFGSANESMKFLKDMADEVRLKKDPYQTSKTIDDAIRTIDVKKKVNIFDYLRTPENVLNKIGLGQQAKELRGAWDKYLDELPVEIDKITQWSKKVPGAQQRIFQWLDGKKINLPDQELQVANEVKTYLSDWATKLGLPKDKQISNYITHIFEDNFINREFDPDIAALIRDKVPGSVYDPFLQKRLGQQGYVEDAWRALDAYVKRATRKVNLDPTLQKISGVAENLEDSQFKYVKSYIDKINMRPTDVDNLIDNAIKSSPFGYKMGQRPLMAITQKARQMVYRGLLGLNVKTALLNLTQGANTYAKLGEKYTIIGYSKVLQNLPKFLAGKGTELHDVGILRNNIIEDRTLNATKQTMQKIDEGLFYLFNLAEKINRGAAYWGAKSQGLAKGLSEEEAIKYAKDLTRSTQFTFGSVDTPLVLSSDLAKTLGQFQSYTLKQGEFLGGMIKNKDFAGLVRWTGASFFMIATIGRLWGMKVEDLIPSVRIGTPPTLQAPVGAYEVATGQPDKYGNPADPNILKRTLENKNLQKGVINYIPAGAQIKKTYEGMNAVDEKGVYDKTGRLKFPVPDSAPLFGPNVGEDVNEYYDQGLNPLTKTETALYKSLINSGKTPQEAYNQIREQKAKKKQIEDSIKNNKKSSGLIKEVSADEKTSALLEALNNKQATSEKNELIREVFQMGLTDEKEIEKVLQANNLGTFKDAANYMIRSLGVENGERGKYLKTQLTGLDNESYKLKLQEFAKDKLLTFAVTQQWENEGIITDAQKIGIDSLIRQTTNPSTGKVSAPKLKIKRMPLGKLSVKSIKPTKVKSIKPPTIKPLRPLKVSSLKVKPLKGRTRKLKFEKLNRGKF